MGIIIHRRPIPCGKPREFSTFLHQAVRDPWHSLEASLRPGARSMGGGVPSFALRPGDPLVRGAIGVDFPRVTDQVTNLTPIPPKDGSKEESLSDAPRPPRQRAHVSQIPETLSSISPPITWRSAGKAHRFSTSRRELFFAPESGSRPRRCTLAQQFGKFDAPGPCAGPDCAERGAGGARLPAGLELTETERIMT